jgi:hypothetical protein
LPEVFIDCQWPAAYLTGNRPVQSDVRAVGSDRRDRDLAGPAPAD